LDTLQSDVLPETIEKGKNQSSPVKFLIDVLETLIWAVIIFVAINAISARIRVDGASMEPTLHNGELIIINKLSYRLGDPQRGDIIVFHYPRDPSQEFIKRVVGLPGDQVTITDGNIYVNGQRLEEPYISISPNYLGSWVVPEGQLFVLGDNRNNSRDSHEWGTLPMEYVIGKALFIYWPINTVGIVRHGTPQLVAP
jgi:signal peptidase I